MENPVSVSKAQVIIADALFEMECEAAIDQANGDFRIGGSPANTIYWALVKAGYITDIGTKEAYPNDDWDALRAHHAELRSKWKEAFALGVEE